MEKTDSEKIKLGIFVITGLALFILVVYFIGNKQKMFGTTDHLTAVFSNVNGLQLGNNVRYSGINIGTVRGIEMVNDTTINVDMIIDKSMFPHIKKDALASIGSDGLVGSMVINIAPGKGNQSQIEPGDIIQSVNRIRTDDLLSTLSVTNKNAALLTADLLRITKEITQGKGSLGTLLNDTIMASDLKQTMNYLKITSKGTTEIVENLNKTVMALGDKNSVIGVLNDPVIAQKIRTIVTNLDQSSQEINKVVTNLNATVLNIKNGNGAINYLSNDPNLVKKIDSTMTNLNKATILLNEDLEAMKHSFLLRGYFKKQEKAKQKAN
ncbi:MlaD family protein [Flavobacterium granuli]|uniref:Phospholipid/cholesterol/gamma-HCH transport system substrate-binding protein n=1 Tax=Flavobacterium granuli TaxID=280093 RepID=A0ABU1S4F2_9FLAO|nr:MlaD family protein [Flavobacterium granuli]MDR6845919.1 phospholipid/cholesterol/gamma-HCH transport system substrate-binding protein [Flavobacterium granuli]